MNERESKIAEALLGDIEKQESATERYNAIERYNAFLCAVELRVRIDQMNNPRFFPREITATEAAAVATK